MNVGEINPGTAGTIGQYIALAVPLTLVTAWVIVAFQSKYIFPDETSFWKRLGWPVLLINTMILRKREPQTKKLEYPLGDSDF